MTFLASVFPRTATFTHWKKMGQFAYSLAGIRFEFVPSRNIFQSKILSGEQIDRLRGMSDVRIEILGNAAPVFSEPKIPLEMENEEKKVVIKEKPLPRSKDRESKPRGRPKKEK